MSDEPTPRGQLLIYTDGGLSPEATDKELLTVLPKAKRPGENTREGEAPAEPQTNRHERLSRTFALPTSPLPSRRHPVHGIKHVDGQPTIIFDTLCVKNRLPILANDEFHSIFRDVATNATAWLMGLYVIMPNHIHFFAADIGGEISYENWISYLKSQITKELRARDRMVGRGSRRAKMEKGGRGSRRAASSESAQQELRPPINSDANFRWLTDHWDTRVRNAEVYEEKWQYFLSNPVRKGLVSKPEDWPHQGEIYELRWN